MSKHIPPGTPSVGAPDPERRTSPIFDHDAEEEEVADLELESAHCLFNDVPYAIGTYVHSGDELLQCAERGVWIRRGPYRPR
jgi:hypothetical protein